MVFWSVRGGVFDLVAIITLHSVFRFWSNFPFCLKFVRNEEEKRDDG